MKKEIHYLKIPVAVVTGDGNYTMFPDEETEKVFDKSCGMVVSGKTIEEAEQKLLAVMKWYYQWQVQRSNELDLWKPFQKGPWKEIGGKWIMIFGINIHFRNIKTESRKYAKGGWYIPFTNFNISIYNIRRNKKQN